MRCATHPEIETNLRCAKCGKPICPKCLVETPVGAKCRDCAGLSKLPTYHVSTTYYLRAVGTGLGMAITCGIVWSLVMGLMPFFYLNLYLNLLLAPAAGYAIGELVSLSVNRKRGTGLAIVAGITVVISYLISNIRFSQGMILFSFSLSPFHLLLDLLALALGIFIAVSRLR
jgi:hypothetical protein